MIRIAKIEDLPQIIAIYNETIPHRTATADTEEISIESRLFWFHEHKNQRPLWVFEKNQEIAGWLSFQNFYGRPAYQATAEISIYISSTYRRQSIAKTMLSQALEDCPKLGISSVLGFIFAHNEASIKLFMNAGFKQWGYLPKVAQLDGQETDLTIYGLNV